MSFFFRPKKTVYLWTSGSSFRSTALVINRKEVLVLGRRSFSKFPTTSGCSIWKEGSAPPSAAVGLSATAKYRASSAAKTTFPSSGWATSNLLPLPRSGALYTLGNPPRLYITSRAPAEFDVGLLLLAYDQHAVR